MAKGYNLTVQLNLQGPSNVNSVVNNLKKQLSGINANVNVQLPNNAIRQIAQVNKSLQQTAKDANVAASGMEKFGQAAGLAVKRFGAFTAATAGFYAITRATQQSLQKFVEFDKQITRIAQVTNSTKQSLSGLSNEITKLSVSLGASSSELAAVSVTLSQAGLSARETEKALKALALTTLAPTFNNLNQTVEGSIALMKQFSISTSQLEKALGSINAVAGSFAVEAGDLITAVQRAGGVFAAASTGVSTGTQALNEFLAVFTSVRATTRESAETIATGLRTIFTRLQRADTIAALEAFGVTLTDLEGKFIGPYRAIEQLAQGLGRLDPRSLQFSGIVEELGGFRQVGKVIPLIQRFTTAQQALNVAQAGSGSLAKDAAIGQQALSVQVAKVAEEFNALIRSIGQTGEFRAFVRLSLDLASALIKVADAIKPVIPALAALGAAKLVGGLGQIGRGFRKGIGFNSGGLVPGSGNTDSVSANLTPGEYVIRKKAVQAIGVGNLERMNRYAKGGPVSPDSMGSAEIRSRIVRTGKAEQYAAGQRINAGDRVNLDIQSIAFDGGKVGNTEFEQRVASSLRGQWFGGNAPVDVVAPGYGPVEVRNRSKFTPPAELADKLARYKLSTIGEAALSNQMQNDNINLGRIYVAYNTGKLPKEELDKKKLAGKKIRSLDKIPKKRAASGGPISGKDTVPALLTPGEYVLNERAASMLGEKTLNELNNADKIYGYNSGGPVRLFGGGRPNIGFPATGTNPASRRNQGDQGDGGIGRIAGAMFALQGTVAALNAAIGDASASALAAQSALQSVATSATLVIGGFSVIPKGTKPFGKAMSVGAKTALGLVGGLMAIDGIMQALGNSTNEFNAKLGKETLSKSLDAAGKALGAFSKNARNAAAAAAFQEQIARSTQAAKTISAAESGGAVSLRQFFMDVIAGQGSSGRGSEYETAASRVRARGGVFGSVSEFYDPEQFSREVEAEIQRTRTSSAESFGSISEQILKKAELDVSRGADLGDVYRELTTDQKQAIARSNTDVAERLDRAAPAERRGIIDAEVRKQLQALLGPALAARTANAADRTAKQLQVALERVFSTMQQSMKAVAADINSRFARVTNALSASLGQAKIGYDNTAMKNVLTNPRAFSAAQIASVVQKTTPLLGRGGDRVGQLAVASTQIESNVAGVIDNVLSQGGLDPGAQLSRIGADLVNMVSGLNLGSDVESVISSQLQQAFQQASNQNQLGPNADPGEIRQKVQEIVGNLPALNGALDVVRQAFETISGAQQNYASVVQQVTDAILSQKAYIDKAASIRREGDLQLRKALGEDISLNDVIRNVGAAVAQQTGGTTSIARMSGNVQRLLARRSQIEERRSQLGGSAVDTPEWKVLTDELSKLDVELANSRAGLELLANSTEIASAALNRISEIQARAQEKAGFAEKLATASPEEFLGMRQDYAALENILQGGQLTLQNSFDAQAAMMQSFAQGGTPGDAIAAGGQALYQQKGSVLNQLKELKPFFGDNNKEFNKAYETVLRSFLKDRGIMGKAIEKMFAEMDGKDTETQRAIAVYQQAIDAQARANTALAAIPQPVQALTQATNTLNNTIASLPQRINSMIPAGVAAPPAPAPARGRGPVTRSSGGIIYANDGQYVEMKPKGTDTVPAMLTKGEFVVNRKATKKNRALLETLNNGGKPSMDGGVAYANAGGYFGAYDSPVYQLSAFERYQMAWQRYKQAYGFGTQQLLPLEFRGAVKRAIIADDARYRYWQQNPDAFAGPKPSAYQQKLYEALEARGAGSSVLANVRRDPRLLNAAARNFGIDLKTAEPIERESVEDRRERVQNAVEKRRREREEREADKSPGLVAKQKRQERTIEQAGPAEQSPTSSLTQKAKDKLAQIDAEQAAKQKAREKEKAEFEARQRERQAQTDSVRTADKIAPPRENIRPTVNRQREAQRRLEKLANERKQPINQVSIDEYKRLYTQVWLNGEYSLSEGDRAKYRELNVRRVGNPPIPAENSLQAMGVNRFELQKEIQQANPQNLNPELARARSRAATDLANADRTYVRDVAGGFFQGLGEGAASMAVGAAEAVLPTVAGIGAGVLAAPSGPGAIPAGLAFAAATSAAQERLLQTAAPNLYKKKEEIKKKSPFSAAAGSFAVGIGGAGREVVSRGARTVARGASGMGFRGVTATDDLTGPGLKIPKILPRSKPGYPANRVDVPKPAIQTAKPLPKPANIPQKQWDSMSPEFQQQWLERTKQAAKAVKQTATQPSGRLQIRGQGNEAIPATAREAELREFFKRTGQTTFNYMSSGGLARGPDQYPAMLSRGEMVMNPEATRRNKGLLRALNKSRGGMVKNGIVYAANGTDGGLGVTAGNGELRITGDVRVTPENIPEPTAISAGAPMAAPVGPAADTGGMEQMGSVLQEAFNSFGQNVSNIASPLTAFAGGAENLQNVFTVFNNAVTLMSSVKFGVISEGAQALQIAGNALSIASSSFVAPINGFRDSIVSFADQTNRLITAISSMGEVNGTVNVVGSISLQPLQVDVVGVDGLVEAISGPITNAVLAQVGNALSAGNPGINVDGLNVGSIV